MSNARTDVFWNHVKPLGTTMKDIAAYKNKLGILCSMRLLDGCRSNQFVVCQCRAFQRRGERVISLSGAVSVPLRTSSTTIAGHAHAFPKHFSARGTSMMISLFVSPCFFVSKRYC